MRRAGWTFALALLALGTVELLRIYWIMPFPGSQGGGTLDRAYALHRAIWPLRLVLGALVAAAAFRLFATGRSRAKLAAGIAIVAFGALAWQVNGPMAAESMFRMPKEPRFAGVGEATIAPAALVLGVAERDASGATVARAYPVRLLGYHHQVRDTLAGQPLLATYCTVCRSGRVFRPVVGGKTDAFRLVGMDRWNAMFEDSRTGSWWRQATGEAVAGPLTGQGLEEVPSRQMTWADWSALHPDTTVMEPDPAFAAEYADLEGFDEGTRPGKLTGRDRGSWREKSWVVGVLSADSSRAFDWNEFARERVIVDRVGDTPVLVTLGADGASFFAFDARVEGMPQPLDLAPSPEPGRFTERATGARWSADGLALDGPLAGTRLVPVRAYQEFWHSWRTFHPLTSARKVDEAAVLARTDRAPRFAAPAALVLPDIASTAGSEVRFSRTPDGRWAAWGSTDRPGGPGGWEIWIADCAKTPCAAPKPAAFDTPANEFDPAFAADGKALYFFSNRPGGEGGDDLYSVSFDPATGAFGKPKNLGPGVNSAKDEWAPTPSEDERQLLFASDGRGGAGKHDLFVATRTERGDFVNARPVPGALNTAADEFDATWLADGETIVFARSQDAATQPIALHWSRRADGDYPVGAPFGTDINVVDGWTLAPLRDWKEPELLYFSSHHADARRGKLDLYAIRLARD